MELANIIKNVETKEILNYRNVDIKGISYNSNTIKSHEIFVCLKGEHVDGHKFAQMAFEKGAVAIMAEHPLNIEIPQLIVDSTQQKIADLAACFYHNPSKSLNLIGITGTNGKTTVTHLVQKIFEHENKKCALIGTLGYKLQSNSDYLEAKHTTPQAPELQATLSKILASDINNVVMEVSSHALEQFRVRNCEFKGAAFTNLTQDHLDYHGSMENYFECKKRLFQMGFEKNPSFKAVINIDDAAGRKLSEIFADKEFVFTYGLNSKAMIYADEVKLFSDYTQMKIYLPQGSFWIKIPMVGRFNVLNVLAAVGVGLAHRISPDRIIAALEKAPLIPGRLERIVAGQPFTVLVDYAHTDDAMRNVLETLKELKKGKILTVFGCGGSRDKGKRFKMGAVAAEYSDYTIITSDNPRHEKPLDIALQVEKGYRSIREDGYEVELDRALAIECGIRAAQPEDIVLICGKGHETYQEFDGVLLPFDDRLQAYSALSSLNYCREEEN